MFSMVVFKVVIFLLLLLPSYLACTTVVCVANRNESECQLLPTVNFVVFQLSDLSQAQNSCLAIAIYLAGGDHYLSTDLSFLERGQEVNISGISPITSSTVICKNASGIEFNYTSQVNIVNVNFMKCNKIERDLPGALYFRNTTYRLDNVKVSGSDGIGLVAIRCSTQVIKNCAFSDNQMGNIKMSFTNYRSLSQVSVYIANTSIFNGSSSLSGGGLKISLQKNVQCNLTIRNCRFHSNEAPNGCHVYIVAKESGSIYILNSTFSYARNCDGTYGVDFTSSNGLNVTIDSSEFVNSTCGAIRMTNIKYVMIRNCVIKDNRGQGIYFYSFEKARIIETTFQNNFRALSAYSACSFYKFTTIKISQCNITDHILNKELSVAHLKFKTACKNQVLIQRSYIERNYGSEGKCSSIYFHSVKNATLSSVAIQDNNCTGISLLGSRIQIQKNVSIARNLGEFGGGIRMRRSIHSKQFSAIILSKTAALNIINNTASAKGGGIFTDETCAERNSKAACPFQVQVLNKKQLHFTGNSAGIGGDIVSGGCLSNCYICSLKQKCQANHTNASSIFWKLVTSSNEQSFSTFAGLSKRIAFCMNETSSKERSTISYSSTYQISAYPGEVFQVGLIVADDVYIPSKVVIQARVEQDSSSRVHLGRGVELLEQSQKYCSRFSYSVFGQSPENSAFVNFFIQNPFKSAQLQVNFLKCPNGFTFVEEEGQCGCSAALESFKVECMKTDYALKVPAQTWIGYFQGKVAVSKFCLHCINGQKEIVLRTSNSDALCMHNRTGVLCGACAPDYSLQLGGYQCGRCSKSAYKGVLLMLLFFIFGIFLIITLLGLNLTVSTGMINAIIFFSNIVHFNGENFLPISTELASIPLGNAVKFLSVFQALVNLDFGVTTCFFDGYNIYASTWMQFVFPAYIWLLIVLIVLASRYSSRISRLTSSRTVPVLATLLLLSYTKLLLASISAISFTYLDFLGSQSMYIVWLLDGNITYLKGRHVPLFLFSIVCLLGLILPFTLLILLGPILQTKSDHRYLHWVNKIKPFLDAFYGPYTRQYRYWPGLLLLARIIIFTIVAFYSLGDTPYIFVAISVMIVIVFVVWISLARPHSVQPYQTKILNYLETFFLTNLTFFSMTSSYFRFTKSDYIVHQQILAVVTVGTAFLAFCGIVIFQILHKVGFLEVSRKLKCFILARVQSRSGFNDMTLSEADGRTINGCSAPTQSTIELVSSQAVQHELREPLLVN